MTKVAIVSPTFGGYGGLEAFVLALAEGLVAIHEMDVRVTFKRTTSFELSEPLRNAAEPFGKRVAFVDRGSIALIRAIMRAEVVHLQNPSADVVLLAQVLRRPLLINVINHTQGRESWRQRAWHLGLRRAKRRFYISEFVRRTWEGAEPWENSCVVAPITRLPDGSVPPAERRGFVFAARWIPNKGVETLIDAYAAAALDPVRWPLVMMGDGPLRLAMERVVRERGLRGIEMPGFVPEARKHALIRAARWMVVPPNTREDFGLTAIEARALRVPCIATRDGGVPEAAGEEALFCEPGDTAGLAGCLRAAAEMTGEDYARRAERTWETLQPRLAGAAFYAGAYKEIARQ